MSIEDNRYILCLLCGLPCYKGDYCSGCVKKIIARANTLQELTELWGLFDHKDHRENPLCQEFLGKLHYRVLDVVLNWELEERIYYIELLGEMKEWYGNEVPF